MRHYGIVVTCDAAAAVVCCVVLTDRVLSVGMSREFVWKYGTEERWSNSTGNDHDVIILKTNSTKNRTHSWVDSDHWMLLSVIILILAGIITISNTVMIACYMRRPRVRAILKVFVFNLCIVDVQNGCIALPLTVIYPRGSLVDWMANVTEPECIFISFWPTSLAITAYLSIVLVTVERFIAILFPMHCQKITSTRNCVLVVVLIWIYSILFSFAPAFAVKPPTVNDNLDDFILGCHGKYVYSALYVDYFLYAILCVPLVLVLLMYLIMYCIARKHLRAIAAVTLPDPTRAQTDKRWVNNSKAAKTTFIMTFIFVVCWVPFLIIMLLSDLCNFDTCPEFIDPKTFVSARIATCCIAFLNSAINPWIYGFRNPVIRTELRSMFCLKKRTAVVSFIGESTTWQANYLTASTRHK